MANKILEHRWELARILGLRMAGDGTPVTQRELMAREADVLALAQLGARVLEILTLNDATVGVPQHLINKGTVGGLRAAARSLGLLPNGQETPAESEANKAGLLDSEGGG